MVKQHHRIFEQNHNHSTVHSCLLAHSQGVYTHVHTCVCVRLHVCPFQGGVIDCGCPRDQQLLGNVPKSVPIAPPTLAVPTCPRLN